MPSTNGKHRCICENLSVCSATADHGVFIILQMYPDKYRTGILVGKQDVEIQLQMWLVQQELDNSCRF